MSAKSFDEKFGENFLATVPTGPGVYRYLNAARVVIYVGKAKNLRRRLQSYRNATRKKVHRKMLRVVKLASHLSYETVGSEAEALLLENRLIQELRPALNVEGAYSFLYPALGIAEREKQLLLCFTTEPEEYRALNLLWYGTFRSRARAKLAFDGLVDLLSLVGHREKANALPAHPRIRGSRIVGLRQIPLDLTETLPWFFAGEEKTFMGTLARFLLGKPRARREATEVEEKLLVLKLFFEQDAQPLRAALRMLGKPGSYVAAEQRDALFISARFETAAAQDRET